jgi:hypothetical protein
MHPSVRSVMHPSGYVTRAAVWQLGSMLNLVRCASASIAPWIFGVVLGLSDHPDEHWHYAGIPALTDHRVEDPPKQSSLWHAGRAHRTLSYLRKRKSPVRRIQFLE